MNVALIILIIFMAINLGIGLFQPKRKAAKTKGSRTALTDYYAAGRSISGWIVGIVVAATMISGGSLIATPSLIWKVGLAGAQWQQHGLWYGILGTAILGKRLSVLGTRMNVNSIPQLLGIRFGETTRMVTAVLIVGILFASTAMQYSASARVLQSASGLRYEACVIIIGLVMTLYLAFGGAKAQSWTNVVQAAFMTVGLLAIGFIAAQKLGITNMINTMGEADINLITLPGVDNYLNMGTFVSYSMILMACIGISRPETNSRYLTMKKGSPYRQCLILGSGLVFIWYPLMYLAGMASKVLLPNLEVADLALPAITMELLPPLLQGMTLAGILGATMSTASALILTASASVCNDFAYKWLEHREERHVKGIVIVVTVFISMGSVLISLNPPQLLVSMAAFANGTMGVAFMPIMFGCLFFPRMTTAGALAGTIGGTAITIAGYVFKPVIFGFHIIGWGFFAGIALAIVVSMLTKHSPNEQFEVFYHDGKIIKTNETNSEAAEA